MIFYTADEDGHTKLAPTQAEAKAINKDFQQIDIPTDKAGLMAFVQKLYDDIYDLEADRLDDRAGPIIPMSMSAPPPPAQPSALEKSINIDETFNALPLAHQLHLAAIAMENARELL